MVSIEEQVLIDIDTGMGGIAKEFHSRGLGVPSRGSTVVALA